MDVDRAKQHYNTDIKQYRKMVIRALNSLRSDLGQGPKTEPLEDVKLDANRVSVVEPESPKPDVCPDNGRRSWKGQAGTQTGSIQEEQVKGICRKRDTPLGLSRQ